MNLHIYHHLSADTKKFLQTEGLSEINFRLKKIEELLVIMGQNQEELKQTLEEVKAEQAASAQRWEVRNAAQQQTIEDLKILVRNLEIKNENSDVELADELELTKQILQTEKDTFANAQTDPGDTTTTGEEAAAETSA